MSDPCANLQFNPFILGVFKSLGGLTRTGRAFRCGINPFHKKKRAGRMKITISRFERRENHLQTEKFIFKIIKKHQNQPWMQNDTLFIN